MTRLVDVGERPVWTIETLRAALREADAEWGRYCVTCDGRHDDERHARLVDLMVRRVPT